MLLFSKNDVQHSLATDSLILPTYPHFQKALSHSHQLVIVG